MWIVKCDLCKKEIKDESIDISIGISPRVALCEKCGEPVLRFLKKKKLIKEKKSRKRKKLDYEQGTN